MRVATYRFRHTAGVGMLSADGTEIEPFEIEDSVARTGVQALIDAALSGAPLTMRGRRLAITDVDLLAPIPEPRRNILCVGKNYAEHIREFVSSGYDANVTDTAPPQAPIVFSKLPSCVIPSGESIRLDPGITQALDYEAELAVIIGRGGRGISRQRALDHVWGYTIVNDVTARDLQKKHKQWLIGKSLDTFCPMGPYAVTKDELDLSDTDISCWVNDEPRQQGNTRQFIFDVPMLIETISRGITLQPGDVIATGTPAGVGVGFNPPRFLQPGDRIRIEIAPIGILENTVELAE